MFYDARGEYHQKSLQRTLDSLKARLGEIELYRMADPRPKVRAGLQFPQQPCSAPIIAELTDVSKSFGDRVLFQGYTKTVFKGDRIILAGPNGSG